MQFVFEFIKSVTTLSVKLCYFQKCFFAKIEPQSFSAGSFFYLQDLFLHYLNLHLISFGGIVCERVKERTFIVSPARSFFFRRLFF